MSTVKMFWFQKTKDVFVDDKFELAFLSLLITPLLTCMFLKSALHTGQPPRAVEKDWSACLPHKALVSSPRGAPQDQ